MTRIQWLVGPAARHEDALACWRRLYDQDLNAAVVSGPDWWQLLATTFALDDEPRLLLLEDEGEPVAAWPLSVRVDKGRWLRRRTLTHAAGHHTYYGDPVIAPTAPPDALARLLTAVQAAPGVDLVDLVRLRHVTLPAQSAEVTAGHNRVAHLSGELPHLIGKAGRELDRLRRRLEEHGAVQVDRCTGPALATLADDFARLHTALKQHQRQWAVFTDVPGSAGRFGPALDRARHNLDLGAVRLRVGGVVRGVIVVAWRGETALTWRSAWDPDFARYGLGSLLLAEAVAWCRSRGDRLLRLGPGDEPYKAAWATGDEPVSRWRVTCPTPVGWLTAVRRRRSPDG
jgi:CelD/BcsL family acetyltransferase involved in cellulose biosynthesis